MGFFALSTTKQTDSTTTSSSGKQPVTLPPTREEIAATQKSALASFFGPDSKGFSDRVIEPLSRGNRIATEVLAAHEEAIEAGVTVAVLAAASTVETAHQEAEQVATGFLAAHEEAIETGVAVAALVVETAHQEAEQAVTGFLDHLSRSVNQIAASAFAFMGTRQPIGDQRPDPRVFANHLPELTGSLNG